MNAKLVFCTSGCLVIKTSWRKRRKNKKSINIFMEAQKRDNFGCSVLLGRLVQKSCKSKANRKV
jgi:hypothetical protein